MKIFSTGTLPANTLLDRRVCFSAVNVSIDSPNVHTVSKTQDLDPAMQKRFNENQFTKDFDLIVIGGGINGCGIARDASERGLRVLLLEKEDFGSGCTSAASRLGHGGLRYLEYFEVDLVRESLRERENLLKNANHLVRPLQFSIPIYKGDQRGKLKIKAGMILYDLLSRGKSLPVHKMYSREEFLEFEPSVCAENLTGAATYYDTQMTFPERICLENALMAKQSGALVLNHSEVIALNASGGRISEVGFIDQLTGKKHKARGKIVLNVSGPWVDSLCGLTGADIDRKIGGTKGSHIIVKKFEGGPKNALYATAKSDSRPFFIIPWREYYLIGTTDIPFKGDLDHLVTTKEEVKYLLDETNRVLNKKLLDKDILFTYCGVRPLPFEEGKVPGQITRRHIISEHNSDGLDNFISIIGGKLTTYRNLSEQVVDLILKKLTYNFVSSNTAVTPLLGCVNGDFEEYKSSEVKKSAKKYDLDPEIVSQLIDLYGKQYKSVIKLMQENPDFGRLLSSHALDIRAQVVYALKNEMACTLSDVILRRTTLGLSEGLGEDAIPEVLKILQEVLKLDSHELDKQLKDYEQKVISLRKT